MEEPPRDETELHYRVVAFVRNFCPDMVLVAGLGEQQDTERRRLDAWKKGYTRGQSDLLFLSRTAEFSGLAVELKTPKGNGRLSAAQSEFLTAVKAQGFDTLVSACYEEVLVRIMEHRFAARSYAELKLEKA
jgi:hypothetical protein